ncbi:hypothetical protein NEHOM01_0867 [Nematocida homosporus]|uniref:uncharacterized protein n=1 Tax=Nematocida homosporus TaxID=1912981 RepID=UPI00221EAA56|nr:uncharacterized protein NEHOM01_0867 [Nematocida homosporus]KAI5185508.1 hypothetical protein NEHOM01_0867 [Nematocida homosporus]
MDREKYSRQIRLFGEETQQKLSSAKVRIVAPENSDILPFLIRLITQIGSQLVTEKDRGEVDWVFVVDQPDTVCSDGLDSNQLYICTKTLSIAKSNPILTQCTPAQIDSSVYREYLNILAGVAVQEYIKTMAGIQTLDHWSLLDTLK